MSAETWRDRLPVRCQHFYARRMGLEPNQCAECRRTAGEPPRTPLSAQPAAPTRDTDVALWARYVRDQARLDAPASR